MDTIILKKISSYFDHSLVKGDATRKEVIQFCEEARNYNFASVIVNACYANLAKRELDGSNVHLGVTISYPLGAETTELKIKAVNESINMGVDEIDLVMNVGKFMSEDYAEVTAELARIVEVFKKSGNNRIVKVIIETSLIGKEKIPKAVECVIASGADYVKNSSGYANYGAIPSEIKLMNESANNKIKVKASGGIRTLKQAYQLIDCGATRLGGTGGVGIVQEARKLLEQ